MNDCANGGKEVELLKSALVAKLVNGKIAIEEAKRCLEEKADVIHSIVDQLQYSSMGFPASFIKNEPHLVNLLQEEPMEEIDSHSDTDDCIPPFEIVSKWKRVYKDKWILGFDLERKCEWANEANIQLIVSSPLSSITNTSRVYFLDDAVPNPSKTCWEQRKTHSTMAVVTVIDHSALFQQHVGKINLNVSLALEKLGQNPDTIQPNCTVFMDLGDFVCEPMDLLQSNLRINIDQLDISHDLMALKTLTCKYEMKITSSETDLSHFSSIVSETSVFTYHAHSGLLMASRTHPDVQALYIAWLSASKEVNTRHIQVDFHTSNNSQLLLLVQILYKILPEDVVILAKDEEEILPKPTVGKVTRHIMKEVDYICETFSQRPKVQPHKPAASDPMALRAQFQKERESYKKATQSSVAVGADKYAEFTRQLWSLQMATDDSLSELLEC